MAPRKDTTVIDVVNTVRVYRLNDKLIEYPDELSIRVLSYDGDLVTLEIGDSRYAVSAADMWAAVRNAVTLGYRP